MNLLTETYLEPQLGGAYSHGHTPIDGIGSVVAMNVGGLSFPISDHRGSVVRMTTYGGSVTDSFEDYGCRLRAPRGAAIAERSVQERRSGKRATLFIRPRKRMSGAGDD